MRKVLVRIHQLIDSVEHPYPVKIFNKCHSEISLDIF
jgi:hypothetical protein